MNYELTRRLANAVVGAGMNDKLRKNFDKFFPPYRKKNVSDIVASARRNIQRVRESEARKKLKNARRS